MGWKKYIEFYCDGCGQVSDHGPRVDMLREDAIKAGGWKYDRKTGKDLCPYCQTTNQGKEGGQG
jgi:uncharacterized Zn-finger protein